QSGRAAVLQLQERGAAHARPGELDRRRVREAGSLAASLARCAAAQPAHGAVAETAHVLPTHRRLAAAAEHAGDGAQVAERPGGRREAGRRPETIAYAAFVGRRHASLDWSCSWGFEFFELSAQLVKLLLQPL